MNGADMEERIAACSKTIFSFCRARVTTREDAEDLAQDILEELVKSTGNLRSEEAFYGFMWALAGNVFRRWLRRKSRRERIEVPSEFPEDWPDGEDFTEELARAGEEEAMILALRRELGLLEAKCRRASLLYYRENRSCADIAGIMGISESMVKYLLFKSRNKLKEGLVMERKLGTLSYSPVNLVPFYSGNGTNHFTAFMQSKIRRNILYACTNDALSAEEISLEIGVPLPYMEDDLCAMAEKRILIRQGRRYRSNVIVMTADCERECASAVEPYQEEIAASISGFLNSSLTAFRASGENTENLSENTLRWQLADQVPGIASTDLFVNAICRPAERMIASGLLSTDWTTGELPGVTVILGKE